MCIFDGNFFKPENSVVLFYYLGCTGWVKWNESLKA